MLRLRHELGGLMLEEHVGGGVARRKFLWRALPPNFESFLTEFDRI